MCIRDSGGPARSTDGSTGSRKPGRGGMRSVAVTPADSPIGNGPKNSCRHDGKSRVTGDCHARFCGSRRVRFPPATRLGVSPATVQRIWSGRGLKPHLVKTFRLSGDPAFEEKLIDVVVLYLNPPEKAVCCAWTRSPPYRLWTTLRPRCQ